MYFKKGNEKLHVINRVSVNPTIGEEIIAIGQPKGQMNASTFGVIEKYDSTKLINGFSSGFDVIYHSAFIDGGSSGGALLDFNFNLIGINFGSSKSSTLYNALSISIPIEKVNYYLKKYIYS